MFNSHLFHTDLGVFPNLHHHSKVGEMIAGTSDFVMVFFHQRASFSGPQPVHFRSEISQMSILTAIFLPGRYEAKIFWCKCGRDGEGLGGQCGVNWNPSIF